MTINKNLAGVAALAAGALALAGCAGANPGGSGTGAADAPEITHEITVAAAPDFMFTEFYVADAEDIFEQHGIELTLVEYPSAYEALEAVISGQADISSSSAAALAPIAGKDAPIKALAADLRLDDWVTLVSRPGVEIAEPEDLVGLTVGSTWNGIMDYAARQFLGANGISVDQLDYQDVKYAQLLPALQSGTADVATLAEPALSKALEGVPGTAAVLDSSAYGGLVAFLIANESVFADDELRLAVLDAMAATYDYIAANPSVAIETAMENTGLEDTAQAEAIQSKVNYGLNFSDESLDFLHTVSQYYRDVDVITTSDEEIAELFDIEGFEAWEAGR